uniref:Coagulation factor V n=1 Tax=Neolamprologus brichardi TaxID=32507 RepID=A0A3Q4HQX0_NEOBR
MRLRVRTGARWLLPVLVLLTAHQVKANQPQPKERHYYIAAVEIDWKYSGNDTDGAEEGETIVVTFRNMATSPYSISPHGVAYGKQSEGAYYFDNTSHKEKEDDKVLPNSEHVYYWEVTSDVAPQKNDPTCLTYTYISHQNVVKDYNSGLIGTLLICKQGSLDESGQQAGIHHEYVFLFGVFDESKSKYEPSGYTSDNHVKYTINGYTNGSLPDVSMCTYAPVSVHLVGMSSEPEVFSVHMNGQVLEHAGHKVSSVGLITGSSITASMVAVHTGRWLLSSHTVKHIEGKCFSTLTRVEKYSPWKYYIAAEEIFWDYAPTNQDHIDEKFLFFLCRDFKRQYLSQSPTRIGGKYKKAVYTQYKDETFTERSENLARKKELGILGPVIRAQIRDIITVREHNMASRPYSIYPHGLTIEKSQEGVNYPKGVFVLWFPGNHSHGVQPGETHTYVWKVVEEDEPLEGDSRCLTRLYHSAVNTPRDIASGLIGPMLICKSQSLNVRNLKADKEQHAMFAVFDENKSWYLEDNIHQYCNQSKVNREDPEFYKSNIMHTVNGYIFKYDPPLGFCSGEVATWHVSSIGAQDYIQTLYIPGGEPDHLALEEQDFKADEYEYVMYKDPYSVADDIRNLDLDETTKYYLKMSGPNVKTYFIAAEEVEWDYAGQEKHELPSQETKFTKVVFRGYLDSSFTTPDIRGEIDEHLGILGPVIKAEVGQSIMVVFRNNANRPYSIHPNGVSYTNTFTYLWIVGHKVGPKPEESDCRTWAYYSGVNPERDIHSGLIGPLLVCREGTLDMKLTVRREFTLLFMTFDESRSWYYEKNSEMIQKQNYIKMSWFFLAINGIIHSLKGLRMYTNQLVTWHLINMGSPNDFHSVHFHGQTFIHKKSTSYRQAVYPLLPGGFATLEMYPSKPGLWQLETEVGLSQQKGMQTLFLVLDNGLCESTKSSWSADYSMYTKKTYWSSL